MRRARITRLRLRASLSLLTWVLAKSPSDCLIEVSSSSCSKRGLLLTMFLPCACVIQLEHRQVHILCLLPSTLSDFHFNITASLCRTLGGGPGCVIAKHSALSMGCHFLRTEPRLCNLSSEARTNHVPGKSPTGFAWRPDTPERHFLPHTLHGLLALARYSRAAYSHFSPGEHSYRISLSCLDIREAPASLPSREFCVCTTSGLKQKRKQSARDPAAQTGITQGRLPVLV